MVKKDTKKCIVMLSGGLDSRLALKLMQEKGFEAVALYFKLPFSKDSEAEVKEFCKQQGAVINVFDATKGKLLQEYLKVIEKPLYGTGAGVNPCIDCKIFMLKKAKEFADKNKIEFIATGEVLGQRPMSQHKHGLELIESKSEINGRLLRPLGEIGIIGRNRQKQIELAKKFKISYPNPAGGCILCEKILRDRLKYLINRGLDEEEIKLVALGRHFLIDNCWIVLGRNKIENKIIEKLKDKMVIIPKELGPTAVIFDKCNEEIRSKVKKLILAYSKQGSLEDKKEFEKYKL